MAQILIRRLDDDVKAALRRRARRNGHSTEQEAREILRNAVQSGERARARLGSRIATRFAGVGLELWGLGTPVGDQDYGGLAIGKAT